MEPLASGVLNSFLPKTRSCAARASRSLSRKLKPSATTSFYSNFFTPFPLDVKGKGRATDVQRQVQDCQTWACSNSRHSVFCQNASFSYLMEAESNKPRPRQRMRRLSRNHYQRHLRMVEPLRQPSSSSKSTAIQTRHVASQAAASLQHPRWTKPLRRPPDTHTTFRIALAQREWTPESINALEHVYNQVMELTSEIPKESRVEGCLLLAQLIEGWCVDRMDTALIRLWAQRLQDLIDAGKDSFLTKAEKRRLSAIAYAYQDNVPMATQMSSLPHNGRSHLTRKAPKADYPLYTAVLCALARFQGIEAAFRFYHQLINLREHHRYFSQSAFGRMVAQTPGVIEQTNSFRTTQEEWDCVTSLVIRSYVEHNHPELVYQSIQAAERMRLKLNPDTLFFACKALARKGHIDKADALYSSLPFLKRDYEYLKLGLYLASKKGDLDVAQRCFAGITRIRSAKRDDIAAILWMHAKSGDVDAVKQVFDQHFPLDSQGTRSKRPPTEVHYASALLAHSVNGDSHGVAHWIQDMQSTGLKPNVQTFTIVIQTFARLGDTHAISQVLMEMQNIGVYPNPITYTVIISYFAKRKDAVSAQKIYNMALERHVTPDAIMTRALLDAYAESGGWTTVSDIFAQLSKLPVQPCIEVYNILLKAYVSIGAPFPLVVKLFQELKDRGMVPDKYTYATFIQSACAAQRLDIAVKTHHDMTLLEEENPHLKLVSLQSMTNIMHALLVISEREQAKLFYDNMLARGFKPSATTFTSIIKAYGYNATRTKSREGLAISENFVDGILKGKVEDMKVLIPGRKLPLNQLFGALMSPHVYRADTHEVERLYQKFIEEGGQDSVEILCNLMEVYRRANLLSKAMAIWPRIAQLAEGTILFPDTEHAFTTSFRSIHSPLSVYIDVLSCSGRHDLVIPVWKDLESKGFVPDSHNWNHLVVALIRAAQPVRAFQVIEKVLLVNERHLAKDRFLVRSLSLDTTPAERLGVLDQIEPWTSFKPLHGSKAQVKVQVFMKHFFNKRRLEPPEQDDDVIKGDITYPLRIMQAIQPTWNEWKPHNVVLRCCLIVFLKLQQGYVTHSVAGPIRKTGDLAAHTSHDPDAAHALLKELEESTPNTLNRIRAFGAMEKKRIGLEEYERRYIWR